MGITRPAPTGMPHPASSNPKAEPGTALRDRRQTALPPAAADLKVNASRHPSSDRGKRHAPTHLSSKGMDPVPPPHRPAPRCATATPPRTGRPPPPRPAVPAQKQTGLAEKGRGFRARCRPPRRRSPCRGRSSTLVAASGETATVGAAPHARRPPPAPSLRLRCQRRGLLSFGQNDTPAAASVPKDHLDAPSVQDRGWPASAADPDLAAGCAPPLRPPARRTSPGRADSGDPRPAPGQRPAPASCPKEAPGKPHLPHEGRTPPPLRPPTGSEHPADLPPKGPKPLLVAASRPKGRTRRHPSGSDQGHPSTASRAEPPHQ